MTAETLFSVAVIVVASDALRSLTRGLSFVFETLADAAISPPVEKSSSFMFDGAALGL